MVVQLTIGKIGWTYIAITTTWSIVLYAGIYLLWRHRQLPQLQMRRLPLTFTAITILHIYWILCMVTYIIAPAVPCAAEYWVMSILVPFGIALFQAANSQFLHISCQQKRFLNGLTLDQIIREKRKSILGSQNGSFWRRILKRFESNSPTAKVITFAGIGMTIQVMLSIFIFLMSEKFHTGFGVVPANVFGTGVEQKIRCKRGWEWWPSIFWQFFWAWCYAPYVLWKSKDIQDNHGWRTQTILCCIAGLPCSPLWLCGLYLPQFAPVNAIFVPQNWFSSSIFLIEAFTVFIPCHQIHRQHHIRSDALAALSEWENRIRRHVRDVVDSDGILLTSSKESACKVECGVDETPRSEHRENDSSTGRKTFLYTMTALECALAWNSEPLQEFAALKDFSGENTSFLTHLARWQGIWFEQEEGTRRISLLQQPRQGPQVLLHEQPLREAYNYALCLYVVFISQDHAEFPLNLPYDVRHSLDNMFGSAARDLLGDSFSQNMRDPSAIFEAERGRSVTMVDVQKVRGKSIASSVLCLDGAYYWDEIPSTFGPNCFHEAERETKYLVLTNTWPKFVNAGYAVQIRDARGITLEKRLAQHFL